jgi:pimeloyl-ACP methyl ester carboxylesterase
MPPQASGMPKSTSGVENLVDSAASLRSQAAARTSAPPTQCPWIRAIVSAGDATADVWEASGRMNPPDRINIAANGLEFGALAWGDAEDPLALLVHGYPDSAWTWRYLGPYLAERGWRAVAPSTRGYAPSDIAPDDRYSISDQAADVLALREALGGDQRAALVGHDWGAVTAWQVSSKEPERFSSYVAIAVPPPGALLAGLKSFSTLPVAARQLKMSWYFVFNQLPESERSLGWLIPKLWRDWSPGYEADEDLAHVFEALEGPGRRRAALRYYRNALTTGIGELLEMEPKAPALYLHGENDGCVQVEIGEVHADRLPNGSRFEAVPGVGHFLHLEDPRTVNALIADWIDREPG